MDEELQIAYVEEPEQSAWGIIGQGLRSFNIKHAGEDHFQRLCFSLRTPDDVIVGGILGETYWDWFHIDLLWIQEAHRGRGYGRSLLVHAEDEARKRGMKNAYLDTFSFQAPEFYQKFGYQVFGQLPEFPPGADRIFLTKEL